MKCRVFTARWALGAQVIARPGTRQARPEPRLAVVTHSSFLFYMFSTVGSHCGARIKDELHRWCAAKQHGASACRWAAGEAVFSMELHAYL